MKSAALALVLVTIVPAVLACCKQKNLTSCCGKGKCNIFCCNCDGGCKPRDQCKGLDLPVCWNIPGPVPTRICSKSRSLEDRDLTAMPMPSFLHDVVESTVENSAVQQTADELLAEDENILKQVDRDSKGHFTYEEFLEFASQTDGEEMKEYFAKFDKNGDGVITVNEMRLDNTDSPVQRHVVDEL